MNVRVRLLACCALAPASLVAFHPVQAAEPDPDLDLFQALRDEVALMLPQQSLEVRERIDKNAQKFTDCRNNADPGNISSLGSRVYNNEYTWTVIPQGSGLLCIYMRTPFSRPLSAQEARDFKAAMLMRLPLVGRGRFTNEVRPQDVHAFDELRAALADQLPNFSQQQIDQALSHTNGLEGCADKSIEELKAAPGSQYTQWHYNTAYSWRRVQLPDGYCIYMTYPLNRGLTLQEALDFTTALNLDLGSSPRIKSLGPEYDPDAGSTGLQTSSRKFAGYASSSQPRGFR